MGWLVGSIPTLSPMLTNFIITVHLWLFFVFARLANLHCIGPQRLTWCPLLQLVIKFYVLSIVQPVRRVTAQGTFTIKLESLSKWVLNVVMHVLTIVFETFIYCCWYELPPFFCLIMVQSHFNQHSWLICGYYWLRVNLTFILQSVGRANRLGDRSQGVLVGLVSQSRWLVLECTGRSCQSIWVIGLRVQWSILLVGLDYRPKGILISSPINLSDRSKDVLVYWPKWYIPYIFTFLSSYF